MKQENFMKLGSVSICESPMGIGLTADQRLKQLYPFVDESKTPLPRFWSTKDKYQLLSLTHDDLRVHYKGQGKSHKDAAAVRANHLIPASCGLYYFEIRIVNKGRDGLFGIGLSQAGVSLNRLPGWDKFSYGYHGDDGHSFSFSGSGVPYGPTFGTGDVIGCGLNLIDNCCFYTKNGYNIGIAFTDLPPDMYPTVGLQTPGEVVEANFGQLPFVYDVYEEIKLVQMKIRNMILAFPLQPNKTECFNKLVSSYLVHHGYSATAESFNRLTNQTAQEDCESIKNREKIMKLILTGKIGKAICLVQQIYPGLLERNKNLLFMLKCRQFVEMVAGCDDLGSSCGEKNPEMTSFAGQMTSPAGQMTSSGAKMTSSLGHDDVTNGFSLQKNQQNPKNYHNFDDQEDQEIEEEEDIREIEPENLSIFDQAPKIKGSDYGSCDFQVQKLNKKNSTNKNLHIGRPQIAQNDEDEEVQVEEEIDNDEDEDEEEEGEIFEDGLLIDMDHNDKNNNNNTDNDNANHNNSNSNLNMNMNNISQNMDNRINSNSNNFVEDGFIENGHIYDDVNMDISNSDEPRIQASSSPVISTDMNIALVHFGRELHQLSMEILKQHQAQNQQQNEFSVSGGQPLTSSLLLQQQHHSNSSSPNAYANSTLTLHHTLNNNLCSSNNMNNNLANSAVGPGAKKTSVSSSSSPTNATKFGAPDSMAGPFSAANYANFLTKELKMMQDAFSLMAYSDPWKSPVSYQLHAAQREPVASALNSLILETHGFAPTSPLEAIMAHAQRLREEMAKIGLGSAAFADPMFYTLP